MDDQEFLKKVRDKIARLAGRDVELIIDPALEDGTVTVETGGPVPIVRLTPKVLEFAGLARMTIEYAVACIREGRQIDMLEFQALLRRN